MHLGSSVASILQQLHLLLNVTIPKMPSRQSNEARDRLDREERLRKLNLAIQSVKDREFQKNQRPARLTITRLKKDCAMTSLHSFPEPFRSEISNVFKSASEPKDIFHDRLIKWAVSKYAKLLIPISANKLRRIAGLPIKDLLSCREMVIKYAQVHNLSYHSKSSLSPFANLHGPTEH
ncbi:hypothetical protein JFT66_26520 [Pseudomonas sp. MF6755]|uniref:hypothetical protein n=1 Tax=Pseudomonas sp. MF6755 TaxID=2797530 RepID=UPI0018E6E4C7|nr:hypothetical protein [Pseudomonas sp. MF6755]MBJ2287703.1 hypothetical protein [Pseudomonas sp. MF6755]